MENVICVINTCLSNVSNSRNTFNRSIYTIDVTHVIKQTKRGELELIVEILRNAVEPIKKTNLLYHTRINFHQLDRYLSWLHSKGLVKNIDEPFAGFQITPKGIRFIKLIANANEVKSLQTIV